MVTRGGGGGGGGLDQDKRKMRILPQKVRERTNE